MRKNSILPKIRTIVSYLLAWAFMALFIYVPRNNAEPDPKCVELFWTFFCAVTLFWMIMYSATSDFALKDKPDDALDEKEEKGD